MPFHILLVEDCDDDAYFFKLALNLVSPLVELKHVHSATEATLFLKREHPFPDVQMPNLIISDCRLDGEFGLDLLEWVRANPILNKIRFVMLCSELNPAVKARALALGADEFVSKPNGVNELRDVVQGLVEHAMGR